MRPNPDVNELVSNDVEFHRRISACSGNTVRGGESLPPGLRPAALVVLAERLKPGLVGERPAFGRLTPHQKQAMVTALQVGGHTVAMTGDGVNDRSSWPIWASPWARARRRPRPWLSLSC